MGVGIIDLGWYLGFGNLVDFLFLLVFWWLVLVGYDCDGVGE